MDSMWHLPLFSSSVPKGNVIYKNHWVSVVVVIFYNFLKLFSSNTNGPIRTKVSMNVPLGTLPRTDVGIFCLLTNMAVETKKDHIYCPFWHFFLLFWCFLFQRSSLPKPRDAMFWNFIGMFFVQMFQFLCCSNGSAGSRNDLSIGPLF